jgi:hypothetical protein
MTSDVVVDWEYELQMKDQEIQSLKDQINSMDVESLARQHIKQEMKNIRESAIINMSDSDCLIVENSIISLMMHLLAKNVIKKHYYHHVDRLIYQAQQSNLNE